MNYKMRLLGKGFISLIMKMILMTLVAIEVKVILLIQMKETVIDISISQ